MVAENRTWCTPRIHGELKMLGYCWVSFQLSDWHHRGSVTLVIALLSQPGNRQSLNVNLVGNLHFVDDS
jgi:hypothetical protein